VGSSAGRTLWKPSPPGSDLKKEGGMRRRMRKRRERKEERGEER